MEVVNTPYLSRDDLIGLWLSTAQTFDSIENTIHGSVRAIV